MGGGTTAASEHREAALPLLQPRHVPWQLSSQFQEFSRCLGALQPAGKAADCPGRPARHRRRCSTAWEGRAALALVWRPGGALRQCVCTPKASPCCHRALEHPGAHVGEGGDGSAWEGAPQPRASTGKPPCLCCSPGMSPGSCPASSRSFRGVWALSSRQGRRPIAPEDRHGIGVAAAQRGRAGQPWRWCGGLGVLFGSACARPRHRRAATEPWNTLGRTWVMGETAVHGRGHHSRERAPGSRPASVAAPACPWQLSSQFQEFSRCLGALQPAGKAADCPGRPARHRRRCSTAWEGRAALALVWRPGGALRQCVCTPKASPCCHRALEHPGAHVGEGGDGSAWEGAPQPRASTGKPPCLCCSPGMSPGSCPASSRSFRGVWALSSRQGRRPIAPEDRHGIGVAAAQRGRAGQPWRWCGGLGVLFGMRVHAQASPRCHRALGTPWGARG